MTTFDIRLLGDPILRRECPPVERVDDELRDLVERMMETMYAAEGIGLAAPQVGVPARLFVYDLREAEHPPGVLVNPEIVVREGRAKEEEGCLSIPGLTAQVERPERIVVEGLDAEGREQRIEAEDLLARCLHHEIDHLDGVLFLDRLSPLKRRLLLGKWSKMEEPESSAAL